MNDEIMVTPAVIGTTTSANPAENTKVSGISLHLRFFTAAARYPGRRKTTQHGANKATAPAKKAAINPPVESNEPTFSSSHYMHRNDGLDCAVACSGILELCHQQHDLLTLFVHGAMIH